MLIWRHEVLLRTFVEEELDEPSAGWRPELDIYEDPDGFVLCLAVPGVRQEDIEVYASGCILTVAGVRKLPIPGGATTHRLELPRGRFQRRISLPASADLRAARTQIRDGLLLVHVPRTDGAGRTEVEIRSAG